MERTKTKMCSILVVMLLALAASLAAQTPVAATAKGSAANPPGVIWRDPGDIGSLDLLYGAGGRERAPDPNGTFTFLKEDLLGTNPKFEITDDQGVQWKVKLGQELRSETAATRLLWAAGYFVDEDYYLAVLKVRNMPKLHRGETFVSAGGTVHGARLERKLTDVKKLGDWDWFDNPFLGNRAMNGLRVMMSLLNNWDLKQINNSIYGIDGERRFVVVDLGATLGNTGNSFTRSKGSPKGYAGSKFIDKATPGFVDFVLHSRPFFLTVIDVSNYRERLRMEQIPKHIPRADARWLGQRLSMLTEEQIRDCFRAADYAPEEIEIYAQTVRKRIAQLNAL